MESHDEPHDDAATWRQVLGDFFWARSDLGRPGNFVTKISSLWPGVGKDSPGGAEV